MTPEQWQRVTVLFGDAQALPPAERAAFVTQQCQDDPLVGSEVIHLLDADRDDTFLEHGARVQPVDLLDQAGGPAYAPGESLGPYRIERLLARGGMGVLYVATDTRLGRAVTMKVLPASTARDPRARARLQREARIAAQLRHPHIVSVHALEELGDALVIVCEYVEGPTLAEVLRDHGPLDRTRWRQMAHHLAAALAAAHTALVIHRDVKASNIVLGHDGLRLVDFGIALAHADNGDTRLTRAGQFSGTPLAQAPEQLEGSAASALSDQFAFGLVLYEAACGRLPYGGGPIARVWARMLRDEPEPLAAAAPQLSVQDVTLVHRCLSRRPEDRYPSMTDVVAALDADARRENDVGKSRAVDEVQPDPRRPSTWWDMHQAVTAALYVALLWPGWLLATALPGRWRILAHLGLVCVAAVATSLRLHLWFSARHYPDPVAATRRGWWPLLTAVDVAYAGLLVTMAILAADVRLIPAVIAAGLAVCLVMASIVIEPATRRASF